MTNLAAPPVQSSQTPPIAKKRHVGRWISALIILAIIGRLAYMFAVNENLDWQAVGTYMFDDAILTGLLVTLELTLVCQVIATVLGVVFAAMGQSSNPILRAVNHGYVWVFRGTPLLVQLIFWYNLALIFPTLSFGIPFTDIGSSWSTNTIISGFSAAILCLALNDGAYMSEIVRGGLISVPKGQVEAAQSIGMKRLQILTRITLPQAIRIIIPPTGNQFINLLKATSLVSVIGGGELLTNAQNIYSQNFLVIPLLIVVSIWYLLVVSILSVGQHYLEQWMEKDRPAVRSVTLQSRIKQNLTFRGRR